LAQTPGAAQGAVHARSHKASCNKESIPQERRPASANLRPLLPNTKAPRSILWIRGPTVTTPSLPRGATPSPCPSPSPPARRSCGAGPGARGRGA
jgi:hypothetical protein